MGIALLVCLVGGIICGALASGKRRSPIGWFVIGFLIPLIGIILIIVLPASDLNYSFEDLVPEPGPAQLRVEQASQKAHLQSSTLDALQRLVDLKDRGALTSMEFDEKKAELLARI